VSPQLGKGHEMELTCRREVLFGGVSGPSRILDKCEHADSNTTKSYAISLNPQKYWRKGIHRISYRTNNQSVLQ
jgi:hypothetical protein